MSVAAFLLTLIAVFASAKLFGELAERVGQPAVLGELLAGIVVGVSALRLVDPHDATVHLLAELGVILLLFLIGLETDLRRLLAVGGTSAAVAIVGVVLPFVLGYGAGRLLGYPSAVALFLGASLTATSVGITGRVLSDLGHLQDPESQVILGAAVIDDIIGLIILAIVGGIAAGNGVTVGGVARLTVIAFGFVAAAVVVGNLLAPWLIRMIAKLRVAKAVMIASLVFAFGLAYLADEVGSAVIVGSFAAGLVLARTEHGPQIAKDVHDLAQFFVPIFFVSVGAAIDLRALNPFDPAARPYVAFGVLLTAVAILGKLASGWAVRTPGMDRRVVGVGMIPRAEVGLIFASMGLATGLLSAGLYGAVVGMVVMTTFVTPPLLRRLLVRRRRSGEVSVAMRVVTEAPEAREETESRHGGE